MRLRSVVSALAAAALCVGLAPSASAVNNTVVVLGDSLPANPTVVDYVSGKFNVDIPGVSVNLAGCGTDYQFSNAVARGSGREARDYTCAGASYRTGGMLVSEQVSRAQANGDLSADTADVVVLAGANDTYPYVLTDHLPVDQIGAQLTDSVRDTINQVRAAAPNARIKVVGYPQVSNALGEVCLLNVVPGLPFVMPGVNIGEIENMLESSVRAGAEQAGAEFVSSKAISQGHEMCGNDRWVAGIIDTTSEAHNLLLHMTNTGINVVGEAAGRA